jgi:excinuclease UvrABC nuclease subunit
MMNGKLKAEAKAKLIKLLTEHNDTKVSFNVPINGSYNTVHDVVIHNCNASFIKKLHELGFSISLEEGLGMTLDHFGA